MIVPLHRWAGFTSHRGEVGPGKVLPSEAHLARVGPDVSHDSADIICTLLLLLLFDCVTCCVCRCGVAGRERKT